ncbi:SsrA-binding protein [Aedoeadaptatus ivorii]|uniref:SsrA-binding protein n=1 Tax=Aedoeadaptatus ivorii TaxID=54006 RepID=A0A3S4ZR88_9FIRM|nr:SsrA-binding protein SmpB [Peptoniphilus ivorii]VEJ36064.1 SsrA-binding protein [Peptoniphilus ivorii]
MRKIAKKTNLNVLANNRKAFHEFHIEERYEAGIALKGTEVKSIRKGQVNIKEAYCFVEDGELFIEGMHIAPYEQGNIYNQDPLRKRKLLMHKKEIYRLGKEADQKGFTLVPLKVYLNRGRVKVEIATARGKKLYDKRESIKKRDVERNLARYVDR